MLASLAVLIGSILIPIFVHNNTEANRKAQVYAEIMAQRERSDTDIRATMFESLLSGYLGQFKEKDINSEEIIREKILILNLLAKNFQEYFHSRPLFEDLYKRTKKISDEIIREDLRSELKNIAQTTTSMQVSMLSRIGEVYRDDFMTGDIKCIKLYPMDDLMGKDGLLSRATDEACGSDVVPFNQPIHFEELSGMQSIQVTVEAIDEDKVKVHIVAYDDFFDHKNYVASIFRSDLSFNVSYFDMPYMDNTRLIDGKRFALVLKNIDQGEEGLDDAYADIAVVSFPEEFMSLRDRPFIEDMLRKLQEEM